MSAPTQACADCPPTPASASASATSKTEPSAAPSSSSSAPAPTTATPDAAQAPILPPPAVYPAITIEFCDRCRWAPRASWTQTELFLTFPTPAVRSIALIPLTSPETGGRFRVWLDLGQGAGPELVWDRKTEGGFPELKILKQRVRNLVSPDMGLGHSDKPGAGGH